MKSTLSLALIVCLAESAVPAAAQEPDPTSASAEVPSGVRIGRPVWVTTTDGREVYGTIASVSGTEIGVQAGRNLAPIRWTDVRLIQAPDSSVDGLVTGAIVGAVAALVPTALYASNECCWNPPSRSAFLARYAGIGAVIGLVIGHAVDEARLGRQQVYRAAPKVSVAPVVLPGTVGISAAVGW